MVSNVYVKGGRLIICGHGLAVKTKLFYGEMFLESAGVASYTNLTGGSLYVEQLGMVNCTIIDCGKYYTDYAYMFVYDGGIANNTTLNNGLMVVGANNPYDPWNEGEKGTAATSR